ncbi:extracellular solute-binding protein [Flexivirga caeni]|uniref:Extracellular solute-binding protein n=1 Tax=Flexivirga caeni TaxID=2294115 RepID=A0A3M9M5P4_9MICO|nr:extracellular solute-binding protein [Flexivirga caeni]RNI20891.1 extracellular solute-binding protein [Flexivirga caeni]
MTRRTAVTHRRVTTLGMSVLAAVLVGSLAACGGSAKGSTATGSGSSLRGQTIVLYSAQHPQTTDAMVAAFEQQTGIHVRIDANDEDVLTAQLEKEGSRSPADVFYTENSNWLQQLADRGMLAKVDSGTLAQVPKADSAADGDWVGVSARISAMIYNPKKISEAQLPKSIMDMADPRYKGKIEIAPAETDFWPIVASVDRAKGSAATLAWLKGLRANAGSNDNVPDNETLTSDVSQGITDFAVINHYYYYRLKAVVSGGTGNAKLAYFAPHDPGFVKAISGAAVLKSSKHQAAAQELLNFMTSKSGQEVLEAGESFEYPVKPGIPANPALPPISSYEPNAFSPADLGTGLQAKDLLQRAGLI